MSRLLDQIRNATRARSSEKAADAAPATPGVGSSGDSGNLLIDAMRRQRASAPAAEEAGTQNVLDRAVTEASSEKIESAQTQIAASQAQARDAEAASKVAPAEEIPDHVPLRMEYELQMKRP